MDPGATCRGNLVCRFQPVAAAIMRVHGEPRDREHRAFQCQSALPLGWLLLTERLAPLAQPGGAGPAVRDGILAAGPGEQGGRCELAHGHAVLLCLALWNCRRVLALGYALHDGDRRGVVL